MKRNKKSFFALIYCLFVLCMQNMCVFANDTEYAYSVYVSTTDGFLNLREEPNAKSRILYAIPDCIQVDIYRVAGYGADGWGAAQVETPQGGMAGWVYLNGTKPTYEQAKNSAGKAVKQTVYVSANDGYMNLRTSPTADYENILCRIPNETQLTVTRKTDRNWGLVYYDGFSGWISLSGTSATPPATPTPIPTEEPIAEIATENETMPAVPSTPAVPNAYTPKADNTFLLMILVGVALMVLAGIAAVCIILVLKKKHINNGQAQYPVYGQPYYPQNEQDPREQQPPQEDLYAQNDQYQNPNNPYNE